MLLLDELALCFFYLLIFSTHYARLDLYLELVLKYVGVLEIVNLDRYNDSKNSSRYLRVELM